MPANPFDPQTPQTQRQALVDEAWHNEQKRRANDTIRVANPSVITIFGKPFEYPHGDYFVKWEQGRHRIPIDGTLDTVRYIGDTFCRDMIVDVINYYGEKMAEELLERVGKEKPDVLLDKYLENKNVWDKVPRTDNEQLIAEIYPQLYLGVVKEFGLDTPEMVDPRSGEVDLRTPMERVMQGLANKRIDTETVYPEPTLEVPSKSTLEKEVLK